MLYCHFYRKDGKMYDYHSHTDYSDDSNTPMEAMVQAAIAKGIKELAITDHYDPDYPDKEFPFDIDFNAYWEDLMTYSEQYGDSIKIVQGIEIGIQKGDTLEKCREAANAYSYDFIIGSFHCFKGLDLYTTDYTKLEEKRVLPDFYEEMYHCLSQYTDYDVIGHFNVIDRYLPFAIDYTTSMDIIEAILKLIIDQGKGLEINTSSYRYKMGDRTTPSHDILKMYKDLGGEILTLGSDAHKVEDMGRDLDKAHTLAEKHGFRYFTTYEKRAATMRPLKDFF